MLQARRLLWLTHNPPEHVGKRAMILPDTCQQTSHQGLSCVAPNDTAWQDQSLATLHPLLAPGEAGRTMLIGSDPPNQGGEIVFIWCNVPGLFNRNQGAAVHMGPSSAFARWQDIMSVRAARWHSAKDIWAARQNLLSINIRASSNVQHWNISQPGCGVRKTCVRTSLHSCCLWSLQGLLERPGSFAGSCSPGNPGVNGAHYEKHISKYPAYSLLSWKKRGFLIC